MPKPANRLRSPRALTLRNLSHRAGLVKVEPSMSSPPRDGRSCDNPERGG